MRAEHSPSGIFQEMDGSKSRRNLDPIEIGMYAALVPFGFACMIEAVHLHLRIPRKEVVRYLGIGIHSVVSKNYREKLKEEDRIMLEAQRKERDERNPQSTEFPNF